MSDDKNNQVESDEEQDLKRITILFCDIRGSTRLTEKLNPEESHALVRPILNAMTQAVREFGGTKCKEMGDGLMAIFGAPRTLEDHAIRACYAGLRMIERIAEIAQTNSRKGLPEIAIRVGLNSGPALVTKTGNGPHARYDASGAEVNLAQRMESTAHKNTVFASPATFGLIRSNFSCQRHEIHRVKDFTHIKEAYEIQSAIDQSEILLLSRRDTDIYVPLVGRDRELREVVRHASALASNRGSTLLITGEAGIGKSRIVDEARSEIGDTEYHWAIGRSMSISTENQYWPFPQIIRRLLGVSDHTDQSLVYEKLKSKTIELLPNQFESVLPFLALCLGIENQDELKNHLQFAKPDDIRHSIFRSIRLFILRLSQGRKTILVFEDIHWIGSSATDLLIHILPIVLQAPVMIVCTARQQLEEHVLRIRTAAESDLGTSYDEIHLAPLERRNCGDLIDHILDSPHGMSPIRDMIVRKSGGNPFFAEEIVRILVEMKAITYRPERGTWETSGPIEEASIPDSVHALIMARVEQLDQEVQRVLSLAAIIGRRFFYKILRKIGSPSYRLEPSLRELEVHQLIEEWSKRPELSYLFRHALTHEAVYDRILTAEKKAIHQIVARSIEDLYHDQIGDFFGALAYHYFQADEPDKARKYLILAARDSVRLAADDEALQLFEQALNLYRADPTTREERLEHAEVHLSLGGILYRRGKSDRALGEFRTVLEICGHTYPDAKGKLLAGLISEVVRHLLVLLGSRGRIDSGEDAKTTRFDEIVVQVWEDISWISAFQDEGAFVLGTLRGYRLSHRMGFAAGLAKASSGLGFILDYVGASKFSRWYHNRAVSFAFRSENKSNIASAFNFLGYHEFYSGNLDTARGHFEKSQTICDEINDIRMWTNTGVMRGEVLCLEGYIDDALDQAFEMVGRGREMAFAPAIRWGLSVEGRAMRRKGEIKKALSALEEALILSRESRDSIGLCAVASELALCLQHQGEHERALKILEDARLVADHDRVRQHTITYLLNALAELRVCNGTGPEAVSGERRWAKKSGDACRHALNSASKHVVGRPQAMRIYGKRWALLKKPKKAKVWFDRSLRAAQRLGSEYEAALTLLERGLILDRGQDIESAIVTFDKLGATGDLERARAALQSD